MAWGGLMAGVRVVASYPGAPSLGTVQHLIELSRTNPIHVEWSCNEKVAVEVGIGASIAGVRSLICVKSVGMNLVLDPLMALNLTPVNGGLVILLGDDPGGYGSQNDQDTRTLAPFLEMPLLEPATPQEGMGMMKTAFVLSETFQTPIIIRETRGFTIKKETINTLKFQHPDIRQEYHFEPFRFVPVPKNAVSKHEDLHKRMTRFKKESERLEWNWLSGKGSTGILASGFVYQKLLDVMGSHPVDGVQVFKLGSLYPLPEYQIASFLKTINRVLILEETEPFVETQIKALCHDMGIPVKIYGKQSRHVPVVGELYRWQIQEALISFLPGFKSNPKYSKTNEIHEHPKMKSNCTDQPYGEVVTLLKRAARQVNCNITITGDPGCLVTVAGQLDAKYAIGSAVGVSHGMEKAGMTQKPVAIFGDSAFFHTAIPAIINAVYHQSRILMVVLDNKAAATTGFQPNPGTGKTTLGEPAPALSIEKIARAVGVRWIAACAVDDSDDHLEKVFQQALDQDHLAMVIVEL